MTKQQRKHQLYRRTTFTAGIMAAVITTASVVTAFAGQTQDTAELVEPIRIESDIIVESDVLPEISFRLETPEPLTAGVSLSESDKTALQKIALAEAEDQGVKGMALVMRVVLNRVNSKSWPNTVTGVITQKGQFTPVSNGRYNKMSPNANSREALSWIESGWDESQGAMYFCMTGSSKWHERNLTKLFTYKSHTFYK